MIHRVDIAPKSGSGYLTLDLEDTSSGYAVNKIEGLDPVNAVLVSSSFANLNGSDFQSSRREERYLKFYISFEPEYTESETVRSLRRKLQKILMPEKEVRLQFFDTDDPAVWIFGTVESFETDLFSDAPAVVVSITCFNPDFFNPIAVFFDGTTTAGSDDLVLTYPGDLETGFRFHLDVTRTIPGFTLFLRPEGEVVRSLEYVGTLNVGDYVDISTVRGQKTVRQNGTVNMLRAITPQSTWLELKPGDNYVRVHVEGDPPLDYRVEYTEKYGGL